MPKFKHIELSEGLQNSSCKKTCCETSSKLHLGIKPLVHKAVHPAGLYFEDRHLQNFLEKSRPIHNLY